MRHGNFDQNGQDIYVAQAQIKRFNLRTGDTVFGQVRPPKDTEKYYGLLRVDKVNNVDPEVARHRANFDELVPIYPDERLMLELDPKDIPPTLATARENPDPQGLTARLYRSHRPDRQGPEGYHCCPAQSRQDHYSKNRCAFNCREPSGSAPNRAAHRRASRRSHRH